MVNAQNVWIKNQWGILKRIIDMMENTAPVLREIKKILEEILKEIKSKWLDYKVIKGLGAN